MGLSRDALRQIWDEVRENHKKLEACSRHDFGEIPDAFSGARLRCRNCDGHTDQHTARWYMLGLKHGST